MENGKIISERAKVVSFIAALCVLLIHCDGTGRSRVVTSWAVPWFFLASGYWFGHSDYISNGQYFSFLKKKLLRLAIPYFSWGLYGLILGMPLVILSNYVSGKFLFERTPFDGKSIFDAIDYTFGLINYNHPHFNCALWFLRTLLFSFICAPLWLLVIKKCRYVLAIPIFFVIAYGQHIWFAYPKVEVSDIAYFTLGAFLSTVKQWPYVENRYFWVLIGLGGGGWLFLPILRIPCAIVTVWSLASVFIYHNQLSNSFHLWLYCCQMPIIAWQLSALKHIIGEACIAKWEVIAGVYLATFAFAAVTYKLTKRYSAVAFQMLTGAR